MDFTMVPNKRELVELLDMLTSPENPQEPRLDRRTGPTARVNLQRPSWTVRVISGDFGVPMKRPSVALAQISNPAS